LLAREISAKFRRMSNSPRAGYVDALQFCNWSRKTFGQMREAGLSAVHVTVAYHEALRPTVDRIVAWNWRFREHADLILPGRNAADLMRALSSNRTAIILGLQNPLPIEDDLGLVTVLHELGIRVMQLTYNNQSLLGAGWQEPVDSGLTRMGREVIREMNRLGMAIDLSHAGERTALDAIAASARPVAITHATPSSWREGRRQVSDPLMRALAERGGMLGLSLYPHHLANGSATTLADFCEMAARTAEIVGVQHLGIGSDLCLDQPDDILAWMREGKWTRPDPAQPRPAFPAQPAWFQDSHGFAHLAEGLRGAGFSAGDTDNVLGANWQRFFRAAFRPMGEGPSS
jgi:microsomal dipeptidase-like Zn-dependent dipeptidase